MYANGLIYLHDRIIALGSHLIDASNVYISIPGVLDNIPYKSININPKYKSYHRVDVPHNIAVIILVQPLIPSRVYAPMNICAEDYQYQLEVVFAYAFFGAKTLEFRRFHAIFSRRSRKNKILIEKSFNGAPIILKKGPNETEEAIGLVACKLNEAGICRGNLIPIAPNVPFITKEFKPKPKSPILRLCGGSN